ncbi:8-amino-7-oxononanoate synthase [Sinorhizobium meliloti]|uniref:8-amino-7-oxononanoate synthase n=1 Tax=Rhizobium meliloti TaxID=382 RepID=UPI00237FD18F|nr:8-amino-7-oxononanoate synthase [Sinorhizobium meliloti]MDE3812132.1 8-amino-7-oxononanoate synthase [Sinorhizobium meliloti]
MTLDALGRYETTLAWLGRKGRRRALAPQHGVDFTSNDYLALADSPRLKAAIAAAIDRGVPVGAGGSRLLRGNHLEHEALETEAAELFGTDRALFFGSGYTANVALFSTLPQRADIIVHDELIHASAHEGIAVSKAAAVAVRHNDADAFADAIRKWRGAGGTGHPWIAVESLYSMDGDRAPLEALADLAGQHDGFLVIDEAHATGVFGPGGRGFSASLEDRENVIVLHTCGKALGVSGALLGANAILCDYLINRARGFIYSTAPSPLTAAAVREALRMLADEPQRRVEFDELRAFANAALVASLGVEDSGSQILPVMIGDNAKAVRIAARLRAEGFDIRAIRPPTVPEGTARLRIAITLHVDRSAIAEMLESLKIAIAEEQP